MSIKKTDPLGSWCRGNGYFCVRSTYRKPHSIFFTVKNVHKNFQIIIFYGHFNGVYGQKCPLKKCNILYLCGFHDGLLMTI